MMVRSMSGASVMLLLALPVQAVQLRVSSATVAQPGDVAEVCVTLETEGAEVAGVQSDLLWDGNCATLDGAESCRVEPATGKQLFARVLASRDFSLRTLVLSLADVEPIPDGKLYCCDFRIAAPPRSCCTIGIDQFGASDPFGYAIASVSGLPGRQCVSPSNGTPDTTATPTFTPTPRPSPPQCLPDDCELVPSGGGGASATADSGGCQVAAAARPAAWPWLPLALALLLLRRRR